MTLKELVGVATLPLRNGVGGVLPLPYRVAMAIIAKWSEQTEHLVSTMPYWLEMDQLDALLPTGAVLTRVKYGSKHKWLLKTYAYDASDVFRLFEQLV